jgi:DNA-binding IscR family transcriptional regulator
MAGSIGVNAVIVRNITGMLRRAGLVHTRRGVAGAELTRPLSEITLLDVFHAVEGEGGLFGIHLRPNPECPVGQGIQTALEHNFSSAQRAMEAELRSMTLAKIAGDVRRAALTVDCK